MSRPHTSARMRCIPDALRYKPCARKSCLPDEYLKPAERARLFPIAKHRPPLQRVAQQPIIITYYDDNGDVERQQIVPLDSSSSEESSDEEIPMVQEVQQEPVEEEAEDPVPIEIVDLREKIVIDLTDDE